MRPSILILVMAVTGAFAAAACQEHKTQDQQSAENAANAAKAASAAVTPEAREMFNTRCATCHGAEGKGNGPASAALNPKPRNYTDKAWQKTVTDEQIKKTITLGGAAVGKSPIMPASPDIEQNPQMLDGLVAIVRQFGS